MSDIRFIRKDGQSVGGAIVCQQFFDAAEKSGLKPGYASAVWHDAIRGDPLARELIEDPVRDRDLARSARGTRTK